MYMCLYGYIAIYSCLNLRKKPYLHALTNHPPPAAATAAAYIPTYIPPYIHTPGSRG